MKRQITVSPATLALGAGLAVAVLVIAVLATVMLSGGGGDTSAPAQASPLTATPTAPPTAVPSASVSPTPAATETPAPTATPLPPTQAAAPTPVGIIVQATAAPIPPTPTPAPTVAPDMVVGVTWKCTAWTQYGVATIGHAPAKWNNEGDVCKLPFSSLWCAKTSPVGDLCMLVADVVATVTVRAASGSTYTLTVQEPASDILLGTAWPPN